MVKQLSAIPDKNDFAGVMALVSDPEAANYANAICELLHEAGFPNSDSVGIEVFPDPNPRGIWFALFPEDAPRPPLVAVMVTKIFSQHKLSFGVRYDYMPQRKGQFSIFVGKPEMKDASTTH